MTAFLFVAIAALFALADRALIKKGKTNEATTDPTVPARRRTRRDVHGRWGTETAHPVERTRRAMRQVGDGMRARATRMPSPDRRSVLAHDDEHARLALLGLACEDCPHPIIDRRSQ